MRGQVEPERSPLAVERIPAKALGSIQGGCGGKDKGSQIYFKVIFSRPVDRLSVMYGKKSVL